MGVRSRNTAVECVQQYEVQARRRYERGFDDLANGDALGIENMGLAAEMILKAAFFRAIGYPSTQPIGNPDRLEAKADAFQFGVVPMSNLHDIEFWCKAIIAVRVNGLAGRTRQSGVTTPTVVSRALLPNEQSNLEGYATRLATNWHIEDRYVDLQPFITKHDLDEVFEDVTGIIKMYDDGTI